MDDRQLLEAAAKAAGIERHYPFGKGEIYVRWQGVWNHRDTSDEHGALKLWNPLLDDGDAFRLAVRLRLDISIYHDGSCTVSATTNEDPFGVELADELAADHGGDSCAATRRAIVRAAAALGERDD